MVKLYRIITFTEAFFLYTFDTNKVGFLFLVNFFHILYLHRISFNRR